MEIAEWVRRYDTERHRYERLADKIRQLLAEILHDEGIRATCESRAKCLESFREKIGRSGKDYRDPLVEVTDLAGVRLILQSLEDVERVGRVIAREFEIDQTRSVN